LTRECNILVVANRTALSAGLDEALRARLQDGPATFTLVVPVGRGEAARQQAEMLAAGLREAGFHVDRAVAGDTDPLRAVVEIYSPAQYDEIIVSTLPAWKSRWMKSGLPQRIERHTGALVRDVEARVPVAVD
jgi:hypothetical protein